jgi:hypothetical protein
MRISQGRTAVADSGMNRPQRERTVRWSDEWSMGGTNRLDMNMVRHLDHAAPGTRQTPSFDPTCGRVSNPPTYIRSRHNERVHPDPYPPVEMDHPSPRRPPGEAFAAVSCRWTSMFTCTRHRHLHLQAAVTRIVFSSSRAPDRRMRRPITQETFPKE